jgi:hypothetical protein
MVLVLVPRKSSAPGVSRVPTTEQLTSQNREFLQGLGFVVRHDDDRLHSGRR